MPGTNLHSGQDEQDGIHQLHNWVVANDAERAALGADLAAANVGIGKCAMQTDTSPSTFWIYAGAGTWTGAGDGSGVNPALGLTAVGTTATIKVSGSDVPLRSPNYLEIDASLPPYGVVGAPNQGAATVDYSGAIKLALWVAHLSGGGTVRLPLGYIACFETLHIPSNVRLIGAGRDKTIIVQAGRTGGWQCHLGTLAPWTIVSPAVDNTTVGAALAAPIQMWGTASSFEDPIINLTDVGWYYTTAGNGWSAYDTRIMIRPVDLSGGATHIYSTRGRCSKGMSLDVCDRITVASDNSVQAAVRAWHPTKVRKPAGSGATVLTLSGNPLPPGTMLRVECTTAGARGTFRFRVSENGGASWGWTGGVVDPATGLSPGILSAATNTLDGHLNGVILNWSNAAGAVDDVWQNWELLTMFTGAAKMTNNLKYQIAVTFDGTTANLRVTQVGSAYDVPAAGQIATTTLTGAFVQQQVYEDTVLGSGCNALLLEQDVDLNAAHVHFGAIMSQNVIASFAGTAPAAVISALGAASVYYYFAPETFHQFYAVSGDNATPVVGYLVGGSIVAEIINGRNAQGNQNFDYNVAVDHLSFYGTAAAACGMLVDGGVVQTTIDQIQFSGHAKGFIWRGTGYYNCIADIIASGRRMAFGMTNCEVPLRGTITVQGVGINYCELYPGSADNQGLVWVNPGAAGGYAGVISLYAQNSRRLSISLDAEGSAGYHLAACVLGIGGDRALQLDGVCASVSRQPYILDNAAGGLTTGQVTINCETSFVAAGAPCMATTLGVPLTKVLRGGPSFSAPAGLPYTDRANFWVPYNGQPAPIALDAAAITAATLLTAVGTVNCYTIAAAQVAALDALLLAGLAEGTEFRVNVKIQANNLLIKDNASGATIDTIVAGQYGTFVYRSNGTAFTVAT